MGESKAQASGAATAKSFQGSIVSIGIRKGVKAESLHKALDEIFRLSGCTSCGLNGFDLHFHGHVNPAVDQLDKIGQIEGLRFADIRQNTIAG